MSDAQEFFPCVWFWRPRWPGEKSRKGLRCRVLVRGRRNSVLVELADGEKVVTSRYAVRMKGERMPEHYTKNTVSATVWCNPCGKPTEHRIDDGRRGPCLMCIAKREAETATRPAEAPQPKQGDLFG